MPIPGYVEPQQGLSPEQLLALLQGGVMPPSGQAPVSQPQQQDLQRYFQQQQYLNSSGMPAPAPAALHSDAYNRANVLREDVYSPDYGLAPEQLQGLLQGVAPKPPPSTEDLQRHFQKQQYLKEPQTRDQTWQRYMQSLQTQADAAPSQEQQYNAIGAGSLNDPGMAWPFYRQEQQYNQIGAGRTDNRNAAGRAKLRDWFLQERRAEQAVQPGDSSPRVKPRRGRRGRQRTPISPLTFEERLSGRAPTPEVQPDLIANPMDKEPGVQPDLIANPMDKEPGAPAPHQADPVSGARAHQADPVSGAHISEAEQARIALGDTEKKRDKKREQLLKEIREGLAKQKGDLGVAKMAQLLSRNLGSVGQFGPVSAAGVRTGQEGFGGIQTPELDAEVAQLEGLTDPQNDPDSPQSKIARDFMSEAFGAEMPETATYALIASQHPSLARMMMARDQATGKGQGRSLPQAAVRAQSDIKHSIGMLDSLITDFNAPGSQIPNFVGPIPGRILAIKEWIGNIKPDEKRFRQRLAVMRNNYIRAITGAQMSQAEAVRIMTALPKETANPATFLASMTEARDILSEQLAVMNTGFREAGYITITPEFLQEMGASENDVAQSRAAQHARKNKRSVFLDEDNFDEDKLQAVIDSGEYEINDTRGQ